MKLDIENVKSLAKTVRVLSAEGVEKANSGHPGMPMGAADYASVLFADHLCFDPAKPDWVNRDRFVLSAGHGSMLLYSLLHLFGYALSLDEIKNFRQWGSLTPGHPEFGLTPGVETTTGPLGAGFSNGVGMALSARMLQARFDPDLFDHRVYGIVSDGDLMEGVSSEAASLAGHLGLGNLIYLYDDNYISIGGSTSVCFTEDVPTRFKAYGWDVASIDGHDVKAIQQAISEAKTVTDRPSIICARTQIGLGSPNKVGTAGVHGSPLGTSELQLAKDALGWESTEPFHIPAEVKQYCASCVELKVQARATWENAFASWATANPDKASEFKRFIEKDIPTDLRADLIAEFKGIEKGATRNLSGKAIQVLARNLPGFVGGSADLEPSTKTLITDSTDIQPGEYAGKNIRFGVREHAMGGAANGLAYAGGWIPFTATFLVFSDYMRPAIRLAALSHIQTIFIFTHDSFWVGEDGPTHQPIEHTSSLRMIPNLAVFRPADGLEVAIAYWQAVNRKHAPSCILGTRQDLPALNRPEGFDPALIEKGAYIVQGEESTDLALVATGSEVWLACAAATTLAAEGITARVVSMPCVEIYRELAPAEQEKIIPATARKVLIEAGTSYGWAGIVGSDALFICRDTYGASAPGERLAEEFGFTPEKVTEQIKAWLAK